MINKKNYKCDLNFFLLENEFRSQTEVKIFDIYLGENQNNTNHTADCQSKVLKQISKTFNYSINKQINIDGRYLPGAK